MSLTAQKEETTLVLVLMATTGGEVKQVSWIES